MRRNKFYLIAIAWSLQAAPAGADTPHIDLELFASHDDNVSRAAADRDIKRDNILGAGLTASRSLMLAPNSGILFNGGLRLTEHAQYGDLSNLAANVGAAYRIQPVVGYTAPWLELGGMLERAVFRDSDIRDGTVLEAHAAVGKRFTDRIRVQGGIGWERRWADEDEVFQFSRHRLFAAADYKLSPQITLYGNLSRDFGDQIFTSAPNPALLDAAKASADDPVFGTRRAYRLGAIANIYGVGVSMAVNADHTLDIGVQHFRAEAQGGSNYDDTELRASWLYRFR